MSERAGERVGDCWIQRDLDIHFFLPSLISSSRGKERRLTVGSECCRRADEEGEIAEFITL